MSDTKQNGEPKKGPGGRPPIYSVDSEADIQKVAELVDDFFKYIEGEKDEEGDWTRWPEPPTVTGLTLHLGFCDKSTLYDYANIDQFSHSIKRGLVKIEQFHEKATARGDKCTGNIFIMKNFGWKDKVEHDVTSKQEIVWKEEKTYENPEDE